MTKYHQEIVIVGAGVMGCQLAYALSKNHDVLLLEAGEIGKQGASSSPLALINPLRGRSARLQPIDLAGLRAIQNLEDAITRDAFFQTGVLRIASNHKQAKTWQKRCQDYHDVLKLEWLTSENVPPPYHAPFGALLVVEGGYVLPQIFLTNTVRQAKLHGVDVWERTRVQRLDTTNNSLLLSDKEIYAEHIFICVGGDIQGLELYPLASLETTLERVAGEIIGISLDIDLPHAVAGSIYGMAQQGTMYLGGNHRPALHPENGETTNQTATVQEANRLQHSGGWFIPSLRQGTQSSSWTGVRCKADTPLPVVHSTTPRLHFVGAMAGRGFLCASHVAQTIAGSLHEDKQLITL